MAPRVGLNLSMTEGFRVAAMPLFDEGLVDAVEWDLDEPWGGGLAERENPAWIEALTQLYADDDALYGHGVWFSFLSADWQRRQTRWLQQLAAECRRRRYRHVSEHFGFFSGGPVSRCAMLTMPRTAATVRL